VKDPSEIPCVQSSDLLRFTFLIETLHLLATLLPSISQGLHNRTLGIENFQFMERVSVEKLSLNIVGLTAILLSSVDSFRFWLRLTPTSSDGLLNDSPCAAFCAAFSTDFCAALSRGLTVFLGFALTHL